MLTPAVPCCTVASCAVLCHACSASDSSLPGPHRRAAAVTHTCGIPGAVRGRQGATQNPQQTTPAAVMRVGAIRPASPAGLCCWVSGCVGPTTCTVAALAATSMLQDACRRMVGCEQGVCDPFSQAMAVAGVFDCRQRLLISCGRTCNKEGFFPPVLVEWASSTRVTAVKLLQHSQAFLSFNTRQGTGRSIIQSAVQ